MRNPHDVSPGDVIAAWEDGTIMLDDGVTTYNPLRALRFFVRRSEELAQEVTALRLEVERIKYRHGPV